MKKAISAQNTKMFLENLDAAPVANGRITAASASAPVYVTFDDVSKLKAGAPVYITMTGWVALDNQEWVLQDLDTLSKTGALYGSNATGETKPLGADATYQLNAFGDVCAKTYSISQNPATSIDTTTLCDEEKTSLVGFRDPGTLTFDFFIDPTDPDYLALLDAYDDGEVRMFEIIYRNGAVRTLPVIVQSINETGGVDQAVSGSATMKITGQPILTQPKDAPASGYSFTAAVTPTSGNAPLAVAMHITESGGTASKFVIDWKDGTPPDTLTGVKTKTHTYAAAGTYTPTITPTVDGGAKPPVNANPVTVHILPVLTTITAVNPPDTTADGVTAALVTFTALDQLGAPMAGINLNFTTSSATAVLGMPSETTGPDGTAPVNVTNTVVESVTVTATDASSPLTGTATANFI